MRNNEQKERHQPIATEIHLTWPDKNPNKKSTSFHFKRKKKLEIDIKFNNKNEQERHNRKKAHNVIRTSLSKISYVSGFLYKSYFIFISYLVVFHFYVWTDLRQKNIKTKLYLIFFYDYFVVIDVDSKIHFIYIFVGYWKLHFVLESTSLNFNTISFSLPFRFLPLIEFNFYRLG